MKNRFFSLLILFAIILTAGCGTRATDVGPRGAVPKESGSATVKVQTHIVQLVNFSFNPKILRIKVGDTVRWENQDSALHDVVSDTFSSSPFPKGDTFSYTFNQAGDFSYLCSLHPVMTGKIIVE